MLRAILATALILVGVFVLSDNGVQAQEPVKGNSIQITVDTNPEQNSRGSRWDFDADSNSGATDISDFSLQDDDREYFDGLADGEYTITVDSDERGWELDDIACTVNDGRRRRDVEVEIDQSDGSVSVFFFGSEVDRHVRCTFTFSEAAEATVTPVATATPVIVPTPQVITIEKPVIVERPVYITPPPAPTASAVAAPAPVIRPPSTGSAGLLTE